MDRKKDKRLNVQFWFSWLLVVIGIVLLFFGFFAPPTAEIHPSVLTAFGEILTFAGAIMGIDYRYRFKTYIEHKDRDNDNEN